MTYQNCPACQNINGAGNGDCPGHDDEPQECRCESCLEVLANEGLLGDDEDYIHYNPGTPHECKPALTVFGDKWVCQYNWCARVMGDALAEGQPINGQSWIDLEIGPRMVGGTYHNGYWSDTYTVEEICHDSDGRHWAMRVRWSDGHASVHSTAWDARRDSVVATAAVPERAPASRCSCRPDCIAVNHGCPCDCHGTMQVQCRYVGGYLRMEPVPERAPAGMLAVRVGSDPWTMVPLDEETDAPCALHGDAKCDWGCPHPYTNPVGWDVIDTSTD